MASKQLTADHPWQQNFVTSFLSQRRIAVTPQRVSSVECFSSRKRCCLKRGLPTICVARDFNFRKEDCFDEEICTCRNHAFARCLLHLAGPDTDHTYPSGAGWS